MQVDSAGASILPEQQKLISPGTGKGQVHPKCQSERGLNQESSAGDLQQPLDPQARSQPPSLKAPGDLREFSKTLAAVSCHIGLTASAFFV